MNCTGPHTSLRSSRIKIRLLHCHYYWLLLQHDGGGSYYGSLRLGSWFGPPRSWWEHGNSHRWVVRRTQIRVQSLWVWSELHRFCCCHLRVVVFALGSGIDMHGGVVIYVLQNLRVVPAGGDVVWVWRIRNGGLYWHFRWSCSDSGSFHSSTAAEKGNDDDDPTWVETNHGQG